MENYQFHTYSNCEMCTAPAAEFRLKGKRLDQAQGWFPKKKQGNTTPIFCCNNCGLLFCNPVPIPNQVEQHYGVSPETYWENQQVVSSFENSIDAIADLIQQYMDPHNAHFLDIGSGMGNDIYAAKQMGFKVTGIEPSLSFRSASIAKFSLTEDEIINSTWEAVELPENHFDFITFGAVLEHLPFPGLAIQKAMKHLKKGGIIQIQVPNARWLTGRIINFVYQFTGRGYICNLSPLHSPFHLFEFHKRSFQAFADQNGLDIVHLQYDICDTMLPRSLNWLVKPIMKVSNTGMEINILYRKR